jgi:hypothetical protein
MCRNKIKILSPFLTQGTFKPFPHFDLGNRHFLLLITCNVLRYKTSLAAWPISIFLSCHPNHIITSQTQAPRLQHPDHSYQPWQNHYITTMSSFKTSLLELQTTSSLITKVIEMIVQFFELHKTIFEIWMVTGLFLRCFGVNGYKITHTHTHTHTQPL